MTAPITERTQSLIDYANDRRDTAYTNLTNIIENELDVDEQPPVEHIPTATLVEKAQSLIDYANGFFEDDYDNLTDIILHDLKAERVYSNESETSAYTMRKSGGGAVVGDRERDKIIGGTVAWNQHLPACESASFGVLGATASYESNKKMVATSTATGIYGFYLNGANRFSITGHKYLTIANIIVSGNSAVNIGVEGNATSWTLSANVPSLCTSINPALEDNKAIIFYRSGSSGTHEAGETMTIENPVCIDLTQMFGSTIADAIYAMEQTTAGAGVAWFKSLFPKDYYQYNAGELISVAGLQSHTMKDANNDVVGNYSLDSSLTLRGIPKLDSENRLYYDGDTYESDGTVTRKYGVVTFDGSYDEKWYISDGYTNRFALINGSISNPVPSGNNQIISNGFSKSDWGTTSKTFSIKSNGAVYICFDTSATQMTLEAFKSYLASNPITVVYEAAEPTTETANEFANPQIVDAEGTEMYICETSADVILPVGHETKYSGEIRGIHEQEPYLLRQSGNGVKLTGFEKDKIIGGTVAWNQISYIHTSYNISGGSASGLTISVSNGYVDIVGTPTEETKIQVYPDTAQIPANHVCLMTCDGWNGFYWCRNGFPAKAQDYYLNKHTADFSAMARFHLYADTAYNIHARFCAFDLTKMFGTEIADYIYSFEQATAGAGVAFFRSMFPKPYYAYNAGSLVSVAGLKSHDTVGFNQWDEQWEVGDINSSTGADFASSTNIRSVNYINVIPNQTYYFCVGTASSSTVKARFYDANKNYVGYSAQGGSVAYNGVFTIPANVSYMRFALQNSYGTTYNNDICINISDTSKNGTYEPYKSNSYALDSTITLRGIPKLVDGKLQYDGDEYAGDGTVVRKYGIVDLGSLTWNYDSTVPRFYSTEIANLIKRPSANDVPVKAISLYKAVSFSTLYAVKENMTMAVNPSGGATSVINTAYTDAETFKTAMNGVYLVYELATPTTETADPFTNPQYVYEGGTEGYTCETSADVILPVGHDTEY